MKKWVEKNGDEFPNRVRQSVDMSLPHSGYMCAKGLLSTKYIYYFKDKTQDATTTV